jgi:hypothetical protein
VPRGRKGVEPIGELDKGGDCLRGLRLFGNQGGVRGGKPRLGSGKLRL